MISDHLNLLSYLLGVIVFSVGFLSTRIHAAADSARRQASDASWRVRAMVNSDDPPTPAELAGLLSIVDAPRDKVVTWFRFLNAGLVIASCVLAADAVRLITKPGVHPPDSLLLISLLAAASIAVGVLGELDARKLEAQLSEQMDNTTLGHLRQLGTCLESEQTQAARLELDALARAFPRWGLLREYSALVSLQEGNALQALSEVEALLTEGAVLRIGGLVAAAASAESGQLRRGQLVIEDVSARPTFDKELIPLWHALRLLSGHLDELVDGSEASNEPFFDVGNLEPTARAMSMLSDVAIETVGMSARAATLVDLRPEHLPQLRTILHELRRWNAPSADGPAGDMADLVPPGPASSILAEIATTGELSEASARLASDSLAAGGDPSLAETIGFAFLLARRDREALEVLEHGISLDPKRARLHWAHAIACWRWGWLERAHESLGRALALDPDDVVLITTRASFEVGSDREPTGSLGVHRLPPTVRLQLAMLGIHTAEDGAQQPSPRTVFVQRLLDLAGRAAL